MYYVIELTCIGPQIRECFKSKELAMQYTTALSTNNPSKHYQIAAIDYDTETIQSQQPNIAQ